MASRAAVPLFHSLVVRGRVPVEHGVKHAAHAPHAVDPSVLDARVARAGQPDRGPLPGRSRFFPSSLALLRAGASLGMTTSRPARNDSRCYYLLDATFRSTSASRWIATDR